MKGSLLFRTFSAVLVLSVLLSGCTDVKQINRITFVTALGIDKTETGVRVHAVIAVAGRFAALSPGGSSGMGKSPNYILSEEAPSVSEALYKMKRRNSRDIQYGHMKIILFSDEIAREGLKPYLDLFMRRSEFQPIAWMALTRGSTKNILEVSPQIPESPADLFVDVFSQAGSDTAEILPIYMYEFYALSSEPGQSPFIMFVNDIREGNRINTADLGVFRQDKLVGSLNTRETLLLQLLQNNKLQSTQLQTKDATLMVIRYNTKIQVDDERMKVELSFDGDTDELQGQTLPHLEDVKRLEEQTNETVKKQLEQLIHKLQELHVDPAGFGNRYRSGMKIKNMNMDDWTDRLFPQLEVDVEVRTKIVRRGTIE